MQAALQACQRIQVLPGSKPKKQHLNLTAGISKGIYGSEVAFPPLDVLKMLRAAVIPGCWGPHRSRRSPVVVTALPLPLQLDPLAAAAWHGLCTWRSALIRDPDCRRCLIELLELQTPCLDGL